MSSGANSSSTQDVQSNADHGCEDQSGAEYCAINATISANVHDSNATPVDSLEVADETFQITSRLLGNASGEVDVEAFSYTRQISNQSLAECEETVAVPEAISISNTSHMASDTMTGGALQKRCCNLQRTISPINEMDAAVSASNTSNTRKLLDTTIPVGLPRRVSFPKSDSELVTGYLEPANPWEQAYSVKNVTEVTELYARSCQRHNTKPLQMILDHLRAIEFSQPKRHPILSLKSIRLGSSDCEALEEIFKRVQYKVIDLSACELEENAASALFEMIEYYEAANELDISYNAKGMTQRGWSSCTYMVSHSDALYALIAHGNPISKTNAENLGSALSTSNLHTLKLEHCGLKGQPLKGLCTKLRQNKILRELWLAYNDLDYLDADTIAELLKVNHYIEWIDISNNNIKDEGLQVIVQALIIQAMELERRSKLQQSEDDDDVETEESTDQDSDLLNNAIETAIGADLINLQQKDCLSDIQIELKSNVQISIDEPSQSIVTKTTTSNHGKDEQQHMEYDENFESTSKSHATKNSTQMTGQSMLDKLLSMGSDSSSDDATLSLTTQNANTCFNNMSTDNKNTLNEKNETVSSAVELPQFDSVIKSVSQCVLTSGHTECSTTTTTPTCDNHIDNIILEEFVTEAIKGDNKCNSRNSNNNINDMENEASGINNNSNINQKNEQFYEKIPIEFDKSVIENAGIFDMMTGDDDQQEFMLNNTPAAQNSLLFSKQSTKAVDVNKNTNIVHEDYDDTHNTDSAFESASESDISRNLSDEFNRITLFESTHIDDLINNKQMPIETAVIATETAECLLGADITPTSTPVLRETPSLIDDIKSLSPMAFFANTTVDNKICPSIGECPKASDNINTVVKVTIDAKSICNASEKDIHNNSSIITTPPPPSISPGCAGASIKRMDSTCAFITQSTRTRSQSSDSLCSDNSLDNSITSDYNYSTSTKLNEKLTKNDTLTRQPRQTDTTAAVSVRAPTGLKALSVWSNNLTKDSGHHISNLLSVPIALELLNIGKNCLSNEFLLLIKENLMRNSSLTMLGCQSAHLSAKGIDTLASILTFGGNSTLQRIDIRDNKLEVESLSTLAEVLQSNTTLMQIDIDDEPKRLSVDSEAYADYRRILENVRAKCSRNEKSQAKLHTEKFANSDSSGRQHGAYNVGSRKISLTCHSRPLIETCNINKPVAPLLPTPAAKLEIKRKSGIRLRSPVPSPPTISPSSSPNRSRFHVVRVQEVSPLTSPQTQQPPMSLASCCSPSSTATSPITVGNINTMVQQCAKTTTATSAITTTTAAADIPTTSGLLYQYRSSSGSSFPPTNTIPVMTSSTQSIKRIATSPRSRFHVSKIYEDPRVPLLNRSLPPITPHINVQSPPVTDNAIPLANTAEININVPATRIETKDTNFTSITTNTNTNTNTNEMHHQDTSTKFDVELTCTTMPSPISVFPPSCMSLTPTISSSPPTLTSPVTESNPPSSLSSSPIVTSFLQSTSDSLDCCPLEDRDTNTNKTTNANTSTGDTTISSDTITPNSPAIATSIVVTEAIATKSITTINSNVPSGSHSSQTRTRKSSWMGTPPTVDKLLTIFQNFQRSSSPDHKASVLNTSNPIDGDNSLVPTSRSSPLSWSKYGTEILHNSGGNNVDLSFLDVAAKQLRDLSKQVFRSNPYSMNENNSIGMCCTTKQQSVSVSTSESAAKIDRGSGGDNDGGGNVNLCTTDHEVQIPKNFKREIKENISPEHTINEETLYSLQKLCTYDNANASKESCLDATTIVAATAAAVDSPPLVTATTTTTTTTTTTVLEELKIEPTYEREMVISSTSKEP